MQILEEHGRRYRIACTSPNTEAVIATVVSGLAVAVLELSTVPAGARILTEAEGFPGFPGSPVMLRRHPAATTAAVERIAGVLREVFCPGQGSGVRGRLPRRARAGLRGDPDDAGVRSEETRQAK